MNKLLQAAASSQRHGPEWQEVVDLVVACERRKAAVQKLDISGDIIPAIVEHLEDMLRLAGRPDDRVRIVREPDE
jgi:ParB-like chromosome segregation protein Spo0J